MKTTKKRLQELAAINNPFIQAEEKKVIKENWQSEVGNVIASEAGKIMTMRGEADKERQRFLDSSLDALTKQFQEAGYDQTNVFAFYAAYIMDSISANYDEK